jgi:hypothetical protein
MCVAYTEIAAGEGDPIARAIVRELRKRVTAVAAEQVWAGGIITERNDQ